MASKKGMDGGVWPTDIAKLRCVLKAAKAYPFDGSTSAEAILENTRIARIGAYTPDGPGWCGDVYLLVHGFSTSYTVVGIGEESAWVQHVVEGKVICHRDLVWEANPSWRVLDGGYAAL